MAKETADTTELDELAFRLYAERIAKMPPGASGETASGWAYKRAEEFLQVRSKVRAGEPAAVESKLSDVCAPNLKATHPHNLVSRRYAESDHGGEAKAIAFIKSVVEWLKANPATNENPNPYKRLDWDVPTTNLAREILPQYVN